jgi:hypothetical protein
METARLVPCDLAACEGMCCHDGAWLEPGEVQPLRALLFRARREGWEALAHVPERALVRVEGGTKTATHPHVYRRALPEHFPSTRCVFALPDARCGLQVAATDAGEHPWAWKPRACWMHPLREGAGPDGEPRPLPPPRDPHEDWDRAPGYPGYVTQTECGRHRDDGRRWEQALEGELARWRETRRR